jgi:hypothetical protein
MKTIVDRVIRTLVLMLLSLAESRGPTCIAFVESPGRQKSSALAWRSFRQLFSGNKEPQGFLVVLCGFVKGVERPDLEQPAMHCRVVVRDSAKDSEGYLCL